MPIEPERLLNHRFVEIRHSYERRDAMLHALGLGPGADPSDRGDLRYLFETDLTVLPTFVTLASPGAAAPADISAIQCRFSGVVFPGDLIEFKIWKGEDKAMFQAYVGDRKVLDQGLVSFEGEA
jgi:MaoC like domain